MAASSIRSVAVLLGALVVWPAAASGQVPAPPAGVAGDFVNPGPQEPAPAALAAALAGLRAPALAAHIRYLASSALEGRGLGSRGLDAAAEYAAAALALAAIPPAGTSYFQPVPVREITGVSGEVTVERRRDGVTRSRPFLAGVDCVLPEAAPQTLTAPVVFAGFGIREPALGRDDYRGLDVRGKIVLVLGRLPAGPAWGSPDLVKRYGGAKARDRWAAKAEAARAAGAAAVLAVDGDDSIGEDPPEARFFLPFEGAIEAPLVRVSSAVADTLLAAASLDVATAGSAPARELPDTVATIRVTGAERRLESRNVVGVLAGVDPKLRDEAVVIGAHLDHLGKIGETVYPGADDNASGVASVIEIAKALAAAPARLKRTVVIAFWTGEEEGKFGSGHWVRHPLWPLGRTAAYLNLDMVGHPWSMDEIRKLVVDLGLPDGEAFLAKVTPADFAEPGLPVDAPELAAALRQAARISGLAIHLDRTDGTHGGSDYRDFARARVPWVRFFGNFFPGYHEPTDTADALDPSQVQRMARLALATAWLLADR